VVVGIIYLAILGYILGLSLAAPPGPVNAIIINESAKSVLHGSSVGAGAMTADLVFLVALYYGRLAIPTWTFKYLYLFGAAYMIYLSFAVMRSKMPSKSPKGNYLVGLSVGISNPFQIIWWITVGLFLIERLTLFSIIGFFLGLATWISMFPLMMNKVGSHFYPYLRIFSFVVLLAFATLMLYNGFYIFLR
jgi:threonine/homoserine/homoserine lactone efflux protein